jgi:hypothetical protein
VRCSPSGGPSPQTPAPRTCYPNPWTSQTDRQPITAPGRFARLAPGDLVGRGAGWLPVPLANRRGRRWSMRAGQIRAFRLLCRGGSANVCGLRPVAGGSLGRRPRWAGCRRATARKRRPPLPCPSSTRPGPARLSPARLIPTRPSPTRRGPARPDAAQPDATQPDATQPDAAQPNAAQPNAAQPGPARHVPMRPSPARRDPAQPGHRRWPMRAGQIRAFRPPRRGRSTSVCESPPAATPHWDTGASGLGATGRLARKRRPPPRPSQRRWPIRAGQIRLFGYFLEVDRPTSVHHASHPVELDRPTPVDHPQPPHLAGTRIPGARHRRTAARER